MENPDVYLAIQNEEELSRRRLNRSLLRRIKGKDVYLVMTLSIIATVCLIGILLIGFNYFDKPIYVEKTLIKNYHTQNTVKEVHNVIESDRQLLCIKQKGSDKTVCSEVIGE